MRVNNIQSTSFGKKPILSCYIKHDGTQEKVPATLYQMDIEDENDREEILSGPYSYQYAPYFLKPTIGGVKISGNFYVLKNDKTDEVINMAKTSRHYSFIGSEKEGYVTVIDEFNENPNYKNGAEPTVAHITRNAADSFNKAVVSALPEEALTSTSLKRLSFSKTKNGDWVLPEKRFANFVDRTEKKSQINYLDKLEV